MRERSSQLVLADDGVAVLGGLELLEDRRRWGCLPRLMVRRGNGRLLLAGLGRVRTVVELPGTEGGECHKEASFVGRTGKN